MRREKEKQAKKKLTVFHRVLAMFLVVALVLSNLTIGSMEVSAETDGATSEWNGTSIDTDWYDSDNQLTTYTIDTAAELAGLASLVNAGKSFSGVTITLTANIDLSGGTWTPIGTSSSKSFQGTFDGGGHTVSGVYINTTLDYQGLFGYVKNATIKNVGVVNSSISGGTHTGGVVGYSIESSVSTCYNTGAVSGGDKTGGVVGYGGSYMDQSGMIESSVSTCYNTGAVSGGGVHTGEVVGYRADEEYDSCTVTDCYYESETTDVDKNESDVTALTTEQMTGITDSKDENSDTGRAQDSMIGFNDGTWIFTDDDVDATDSSTTTTYYYPVLLSNKQDPAPCVVEEVNFYTVAATLGDNVTLASGDLSQTVTSGSKITDIVINADTGYGFTNDYITSLNTTLSAYGLTATRDGSNQTITISGTPTAGYTVIISATEQENAQTPAFETDLVSATYEYSATVTPLDGTATVTDGGTVKYQWYNKSGDGDGEWSALTSNNNIDTPATYTPTASTMSPTYSYYVTATNTIKDNGDGGTKTATAESNKVAIEIIAPIPVISTDLSTETVSYYYSETPSDLTITASQASGAMETLSYQWYKQGADGSEFVAISGETSTTYKPDTTLVGTTNYKCVVTNTYSNETSTVESSVATITVAAQANAETPIITTDLSTTEVSYDYGETITALDGTAKVTDGGTVTYQWYKQDAENSDFVAIDGETNATYTPSNTEIGTYSYYVIATNTITDNNDGGTKTATTTSKTATITVAYGTFKSDMVSYASANDNGWYNNDIVITATNGYTISTSPTEGYASSITIDTEGTALTQTYYVKNTETGGVCEATLEYSLDKIAPTATISAKKSTWKEVISTITFGLFFKDEVEIIIEGADSLSLVDTVEYQKVSSGESCDVAGTWTKYTELTVDENAVFKIYAKVTDKAGNYVIINTENIVVYTDSEQVTSSFEFVKSGNDDNKTVSVKTYGNTVNKITLDDDDEVDSQYYTVGDEDNSGITIITFTADYLKGLDGGSYTFTISYNPLGEAYVDETGNEAPEDTTITAKISKADNEVTVSMDDWTYGDDNVSPSAEATFSSTDYPITYTYYSDKKCTTEVTKLEYGTYYVVASVAETDDYNAGTSDPVQFTRSRADLEDCEITAIADQTYTGSAISPSVTVTFKSERVYDEYKVAYSNNTKVGTATVTITGEDIANFTGEVEVTFEIVKANPSYTVPTDLKATYGDTLQDVKLPDGFAFEDDETTLVGDVGANTFAVTYTPGDTDNYKVVTDIKVSINVAQADNEITNFGLTSWLYGATASTPSADATFGEVEFTYYSDEDCTDKIDKPSTVGTYYVKATVTGTDNYEGASSDVIGFSISYATVETGSYSVTSAGWTNVYEIEATGDYEIATSADGTFDISIKITEESKTKDGTDYTFYIKNDDGTIAKETVTYKLDTTAPTGTITIGTSIWDKFLSVITFGIYKSDSVTVKIAADADLSGEPSIEYITSSTAISENAIKSTTEWNTYNSLTMEANTQFIVYAKITDEAGNVTYISSDGVTVYTDSAVATSSISFTKLSTTDVTADVTTNGNTILAITNGEYTLTSNDYTVATESNNTTTITFKASYLDTLSSGDYTFTISYNPMGETYVVIEDNEAPKDTTITANISKADTSVVITEIDNASYENDITLTATVTGVNGVIPTGTVTFYNDGTQVATVDVASDGTATYTMTSPIASTYSITAEFTSSDDNYNDSTTTSATEFDITKTNQVIEITEVAAKTYGDDTFALAITGQNDTSTVTYSVADDNGVVEITGNTVTIIGAGTVTITATVDGDNNYNGDSATYDLTVAQKALSVVIDDQEIVRGMSIPTFTSTVSGNVDGDVITVAYSTITDNMTAGDYTITMTNTSDYANYDITVTSGTLTITDGYTVSFDDTEVTDIAYGATVSQPTDPTKDGYIFSGWYLGDSAFDFTTAITGDLELTSVWEAVVEKEMVTTGSAEVTIDAEIEEQLLDELFTEEEIALNVEMKATVQVDVVEVTDMDASAQEEFTTYLEAYQADLAESETVTQAMVFNISVIKSLAGVEETITELETPIRMTIEIPEEYQSDSREFFILRNHDGEITILEDLDDDPTTITIETDRFSNYTLNYVEPVEADADGGDDTDVDGNDGTDANSNDGTDADGDDGTDANSNDGTDVDGDYTVPDTGDYSSTQMFMILMFVSLLGILAASKKKVVK